MTLIELPDERRRKVLELLEAEGRVLAADLAARFATSEDTIRRDLREMDRLGLLRRVHGGAIRTVRVEPSFSARAVANPGRKSALAAAACRLVRSNEVVLIDGGTTNLAIAQALPDGHAATIITNSPEIAVATSEFRLTEVVMLGGTVHPGRGTVAGALTTRQIEDLRPDLCLIGACSIDLDSGLCAANAEEAALKQVMAKVSRRKVVAVLNERLFERAAFRALPLTALDHLVVEADAPPEIIAQITAMEAGPDLIIAGKAG